MSSLSKKRAETSFGENQDLRVIRRLPPTLELPRAEAPGTRLALIVDVETSGLTPPGSGAPAGQTDEIVELAIRPMTYRAADGVVLALHTPYVGLRQPSRPLSPEVEALVGLDESMLAGTRLDLEAVDSLLAECAIVIAHSAKFDRPFLEALSPNFAQLPWACSIEDADWPSEGIESGKLCFVAAMGFSFFFDSHRALDDVDAVAAILSRDAPKSAGTILDKVLRSARNGRWRVRIFDADFDARERIKAAGYRWEPGGSARRKCWFRDLGSREEAFAAGAAAEAFTGARSRTECVHLDARVRFSGRI